MDALWLGKTRRYAGLTDVMFCGGGGGEEVNTNRLARRNHLDPDLQDGKAAPRVEMRRETRLHSTRTRDPLSVLTNTHHQPLIDVYPERSYWWNAALRLCISRHVDGKS